MTKTRNLADLGGGFIQAGTGAVQRTVESKLQDVVSVKDFGAVGDGVTDDTAAIQAAITAASQVVYVPNGKYKITAQIVIPEGKIIQGTGGITNNRYNRSEGVIEELSPRFYIDFGSGIDDSVKATYFANAAVYLRSGSGIAGVSFWYPNQTLAMTSPTATAYPPAIATEPDCQNALIERIHLGNAYVGIDVTRDSTNVVIKDIKGIPLKKGIILGGTQDPAYIENIRFTLASGWDLNDPYSDPETREWLFNNATAVELRRTTWTHLSNVFVYSYNKGVELTESVTEADLTVVGPANNLSIESCGFDNCKYGIYSQPGSTYDVGTIAINNCRFASDKYTTVTAVDLVPEASVRIENTAYAKPNIIITGCAFTKAGKNAIDLLGSKRSVITGNTLDDAGAVYDGATFPGPYYFIKIRDCDRSIVSDNNITSSSGQAKGISVEYSNHVLVRGNVFSGLKDSPIYFLDSDFSRANDNVSYQSTVPMIGYNSQTTQRDLKIGTNCSTDGSIFTSADVDVNGILNIPTGTPFAMVDGLGTVNGITTSFRGAELILRCGATGFTLTDQDASTPQPQRLYLNGNFVTTFGDVLHLVSAADGGWYEVSRSPN